MKEIKLTESQLRKVLVEAVRGILNELGGGIHPSGQMDLFMNQDEVDDFHGNADDSMYGALLAAERECGWSHSKSVPVHGGMRYDCYSDDGKVSSKRFFDCVLRHSPRPQNVKLVKLRYRYAPEITRLGVVLLDVND